MPLLSGRFSSTRVVRLSRVGLASLLLWVLQRRRTIGCWILLTCGTTRQVPLCVLLGFRTTDDNCVDTLEADSERSQVGRF